MGPCEHNFQLAPNCPFNTFLDTINSRELQMVIHRVYISSYSTESSTKLLIQVIPLDHPHRLQNFKLQITILGVSTWVGCLQNRLQSHYSDQDRVYCQLLSNLPAVDVSVIKLSLQVLGWDLVE